MKHAHTPRILRASTAIFAVLALGSTPVWAQDAAAPAVEAPVVSLPAPSAPAPAAPVAQTPTIQLPTQAPAPAAPAQSEATIVSQPMVQQAPEAVSPAAEVAPVERAARRTVERPAAAPARQAATAPARSAPVQVPVASAAPAQIAPESQTPPVAPVPLAQPEVTPLPADNVAPTPAQASDPDMSLAAAGGVAALLLALGLGGGAYAAMRARRRRRLEAEQEVYETQPVQVIEPVAVAANAPTGGREPEAALPAYAAVADEAEVTVVEPTPRPTVAQRIGSEELATQAAPSGEAFVMPDGPVPQTRAERDALLDRMASAPPSAENPFTSRKARLRRARIILQSREIQQKQDATKPFDWRTYKSSTSNPAPATPPRVTA